MVQIVNFLVYKNKTNIIPTTAITVKRIFTDFKYFFVSGFISFFENAPAPKDITIKKMNTRTSITIKIPNLLNIKP